MIFTGSLYKLFCIGDSVEGKTPFKRVEAIKCCGL